MIYVNNPNGINVTVTGTTPQSKDLPLKAGWNLIPYPYLSKRSVEDALGNLKFGVDKDYDKVLYYDTASGDFKEYSETVKTLTELEPTKSYYIRCVKDTTYNLELLSRTTKFFYDGDGGRVKKRSDIDQGQTTTYIGSLFEITRTDADPERNTQTKHIFAGANRICSVRAKDSETKTTYIHGDHLGSSSVITDETGQQVALYEYSPFGEFARTEAPPSDLQKPNHFYTGKELDDTGLYYYGARYYDPVIGHFITPDSIIQAPFDPQSLNRYSYCRNNPINLIDPTGHKWSWKKFWNSFAGAFLAVLVGLVTYGAGWSLMAVGFWSGLTGGALSGGLEGGWKGALLGGLMGGALGALGGWAAGVKYGGWIIGGMIAGGVANTAVNGSWDSFVGGITGAITGAVAGAAYLSSGQPGSYRQKLASQLEQRKQAEKALTVNANDKKDMRTGARGVGGEDSSLNHMFNEDGAGTITEMGPNRDGKITVFEYNKNDKGLFPSASLQGDTPRNTMEAINSGKVTYSNWTKVSGSAYDNMMSSYKGIWSSELYVGGSYNSNYAANTWIYGSGGEIKGEILKTNRPSFAGKYYEGK